MSDKLETSIIAVLGEIPSTWPHYWYQSIQTVKERLPRLQVNGILQSSPVSTYLIYLLSKPDKNYCAYMQSITSDPILSEYNHYFSDLANDAHVIAVTDVSNFQQELDAFDDIEKAICKPHLYISPLFRYMRSMEMSYDFLVDDILFHDAQYQLRKNPYFFEAYGDELKIYMPLLWEEI